MWRWGPWKPDRAASSCAPWTPPSPSTTLLRIRLLLRRPSSPPAECSRETLGARPRYHREIAPLCLDRQLFRHHHLLPLPPQDREQRRTARLGCCSSQRRTCRPRRTPPRWSLLGTPGRPSPRLPFDCPHQPPRSVRLRQKEGPRADVSGPAARRDHSPLHCCSLPSHCRHPSSKPGGGPRPRAGLLRPPLHPCWLPRTGVPTRTTATSPTAITLLTAQNPLPPNQQVATPGIRIRWLLSLPASSARRRRWRTPLR